MRYYFNMLILVLSFNSSFFSSFASEADDSGEEGTAQKHAPRNFWGAFAFEQDHTDALYQPCRAAREDYNNALKKGSIGLVKETLVFTRRAALHAAFSVGTYMRFDKTSPEDPFPVDALCYLPTSIKQSIACIECKRASLGSFPKKWGVQFPNLLKISIRHTNMVLGIEADTRTIRQTDLDALCGIRKSGRRVHVSARGHPYATHFGTFLTARRLRKGDTITDSNGVVAHVVEDPNSNNICLLFPSTKGPGSTTQVLYNLHHTNNGRPIDVEGFSSELRESSV